MAVRCGTESFLESFYLVMVDLSLIFLTYLFITSNPVPIKGRGAFMDAATSEISATPFEALCALMNLFSRLSAATAVAILGDI